jgi:hypothetical protein
MKRVFLYQVSRCSEVAAVPGNYPNHLRILPNHLPVTGAISEEFKSHSSGSLLIFACDSIEPYCVAEINSYAADTETAAAKVKEDRIAYYQS